MNIVLHSFLPLRAESASDEDEDESVVVPKAAQRHPPAKMVSMEDWLALASKPGGMQTALSHGMPRRSSLGKTLVEITQNTGGSIDHQAKQLKKREYYNNSNNKVHQPNRLRWRVLTKLAMNPLAKKRQKRLRLHHHDSQKYAVANVLNAPRM